MIATIIVNLPEEIRNQLENEINLVFEKYSQFRVGASGPTKYKNFPHITITRVDDAQKSMGEIVEVVKNVAQLTQFQIKVTGVSVIEGGGSFHVVLEIEKNESLKEIHEKIFQQLFPLINEDWRKLGGENYHPHISIITWMPKEKALEVASSINIKPFKFFAKEIAIKTMDGKDKAKVFETFQLR